MAAPSGFVSVSGSSMIVGGDSVSVLDVETGQTRPATQDQRNSSMAVGAKAVTAADGTIVAPAPGGLAIIELRERAVRMVLDHGHEYGSQWEAICSVAEKLGPKAETLRCEVARLRT